MRSPGFGCPVLAALHSLAATSYATEGFFDSINVNDYIFIVERR